MSSTLLVCRISDAKTELERYPDLLDRREHEQLAGMRWPAARRRHLVARALLRLELAERLGCGPDRVLFDFGDQGKPAVRGDGRWRFNLSHSHDRVVLALRPAADIGVDIEYHGRRSRITDLAAHYFAELERAQLEALPPALRRRRFFQLWTLKEAYAKARGESLWATLAGTALDVDGPDGPRLHLAGAAASTHPISFWHFALDTEYSLALMELDAAPPRPPVAYRVIPGVLREPLPLVADLAGRYLPE